MKKLLTYSLVIAFLVSCKKDDKKCNLDMAGVSGNYRVTAVRYKANASAAETDYYNAFFPDPCDRDDVLTLNANGTYVLTDAGTRCTPSNDDNGNWSLAGNTMTIDGSPSNVDAFSCASLTISETNVFNAGDKLTLVLTRQ